MKKITILILTVMLICLSACSDTKETNVSDNNADGCLITEECAD